MERKLDYGWNEESPRAVTEDMFETIDMGTHSRD
jgi:hypothetical protein